jgi:hypothetical protein
MEDNLKKVNLASIIATIIIIVAVIIIAVIIINKRVDYVNEIDAKFIGNNSILYVQTGCLHCINQEEMFGDNIKYLTIVDCFKEENRKKCSDIGIEATPTWVIKGNKYPGFRTLKELKLLLINS